MARTQAIDYEEKRKTITQNAARIFARDGFAGASLSDVAESCKMSKSLIYHYYDSKEAILYDVMNEHMDDLVGVIKEINQSSSQPIEKFGEFVKTLMRHYIGTANSQKVLLYELNSLRAAERNEIVKKQRILIEFTEKLLLAIHPDMRNQTPLLRARIMLFFGMINWTHNWFNPKGPIDRDQVAELAAHMTLKSLSYTIG